MSSAAAGSSETGNLFWVRPEFLSCLEAVGAKEKILSKKQILTFLNKYILVKKLYNAEEAYPPKTFYLNDDPLAKVLGVKQFTAPDLRTLLPYQLVAVTNKRESNDSTDTTVDPADRKRKLSQGENVNGDVSDEASVSKRVREEPVTLFPFGVFIVPSAPKYFSGDETDYSVQSMETELVRDSGDDVLLADGAISILEYARSRQNICSTDEDDDEIRIEYEVQSASSLDSNCSDTSSDTEDVLCAALLICKDDSDMAFWADESDEDTPDPEMTLADKWSCTQCGSLNQPLSRFCQRCWDMRVHWLPEKNKNHPPTNLKKRPRPKASERPIGKVLPFVSSKYQLDSSPNCEENVAKEKLSYLESLPSTSQEISSSLEFSQDSGIVLKGEKVETKWEEANEKQSEKSLETDKNLSLCPICSKRPKTGIFVHGSTSHQYCCYKCAKILQKSGKSCPVCRRRICRVLRNFIID